MRWRGVKWRALFFMDLLVEVILVMYLVRFSLEDDVKTFPLCLNNMMKLLLLVIFCSG